MFYNNLALIVCNVFLDHLNLFVIMMTFCTSLTVRAAFLKMENNKKINTNSADSFEKKTVASVCGASQQEGSGFESCECVGSTVRDTQSEVNRSLNCLSVGGCLSVSPCPGVLREPGPPPHRDS